jgi:hypothetical protein
MNLRQEQDLSIKLENIMQIMTKLITNPDYKIVKEKFPVPQRDADTGLLKFDIANPFYANIWPRPMSNYKI